MATCKICDVRDYQTARLCAELGADFLGLHCIRGIPPERQESLLEIASRCPDEFPRVGLVVVTLLTAADEICPVVLTLRPTYIQLHSAEWTGNSIRSLREEFARQGYRQPRIIAVAKVPGDSRERVTDICGAADFLLLDRTHYNGTERPERVPPEKYRDVIFWADASNTPAFVAGGLTATTVRDYIEVARPWGVDVQSGVEVEGQRGTKDPEKLRAFVNAVKSLDSGSKC